MATNHLTAGLESMSHVFNLVNRTFATVMEDGTRRPASAFPGPLPDAARGGGEAPIERGPYRSTPGAAPRVQYSNLVNHLEPHMRRGIVDRGPDGMPFYGPVPHEAPSSSQPQSSDDSAWTSLTDLLRQIAKREGPGKAITHPSDDAPANQTPDQASTPSGTSLPSGLGNSASSITEPSDSISAMNGQRESDDWPPNQAGESNRSRPTMPPLPSWVTSLPSSPTPRRRGRFANPRTAGPAEPKNSPVEKQDLLQKLPDRLADMHALLLRMSDSLRKIEKGRIPARFS